MARIHILLLTIWMASAAFAQEAQQPPVPPVQIPQQSEPAPPSQERTAPAAPARPPAAASTSQPRRDGATEYWPSIRGYRLKITDTLIAVFILLLLCVTWLLWRALRKLVDNSELNAERQLRAYLAVVPKTISGFRPSGVGRIEWVVRNLGQTPANRIRHRYSFAVLAHPLPARHRFPEPTREISGAALLPRDETVIHLDGEAFTTQQIEAVSRNEARIHCWGYAEYQDVFKVRWRSRFSVSVGGEAFSRAANLPPDHPSAPAWTWEYGPGHNEIDHAR